MTTREQVVAEARSWVGTPYLHQAHIKGEGCDCGGLIGGVAMALGLARNDFWSGAFAPFSGYGREPAHGSLLRVLDTFMTAVDPMQVGSGDVVVMRFRREPQHLGIVVPYTLGGHAIVHALNGISVHEVVEHRLDGVWQRRVTHAYRLPGVS